MRTSTGSLEDFLWRAKTAEGAVAENESTPRTVLEGPVLAGGDIARIVSDGSRAIAEAWTASGWRPSAEVGGPTVDEIMSGAPASPRTLEERGIPSSEG